MDFLSKINNFINVNFPDLSKRANEKTNEINPNLKKFGIDSEDDYVLTDFGGLNLYKTNDGKNIIEDSDGSLVVSYELESGDSVQERYNTSNNLTKKEIDLHPSKSAYPTKYIESYAYNSNNELSSAKVSEYVNKSYLMRSETFYFYKYGEAGNVVGKKQAMYNYESGKYISSQYDASGKLLYTDIKDIDDISAASSNSIIDKPVTQNGIGDCWLIAGVASLSYNELGQEVLKNSVSKNEDGSYGVYFKGIPKIYTITSEEIAKNKETLNKYALGDNDMRIIELAMEKYRDELRENTDDSPISGFFRGIQDFFANSLLFNQYAYKTNYDFSFSSLTGGNSAQVFKLLTGNDVNFEVLYGLEGANKSFNAKENCIAVIDFFTDFSVKDTDGYTVDLITKHAYALKEINDDYAVITNPEDTNHDLKIPLSEFEDIKARLAYTYLS